MFVLYTFVLACSGIQTINSESSIEKKTLVQEKPNKKNVPVINREVEVEVQPGKVTFVEFGINLPDGKWELNCRDKEVPFVVQKGKAQLILAESYFSNLKPYKCFLISDNDAEDIQEVSVLDVTVKPFKYKSERLYVDQKKIDIVGEDLKRVIREKEIKRKIYLETASYYLFDQPFVAPLKSYITSIYGNKRIFNNKKESQHLGFDFRAKVGVPIPASNKGRVVYTGDLFFIGKVVVVDHGLDIFTAYGHLSKIKVRKGDFVKQGDIVGLSGRTGRVSGPHLHWGVRVQGQWVDGYSLIEQSALKFQ